MVVVVTGWKEVDDLLKQMPLALNHRVIGAANVAASKPLVERAKQLAPKGKTKNLVNSIGAVKLPMSKVSVVGTVHVRPRVKGGYKGRHGHLVEGGVFNRPPGGWYARYPNAHPTNQPAQPFMGPAFRQTETQVVGEINNQIAIKLRDLMKRTLKKRGAWTP